jgi:xylulokinase
VVDAHTGDVRSGATREYPLLTPKPQWAEQNPEHWWRAAHEAIGAAVRGALEHGADLVALGLTGQMHGLTLLDERSQPLRPAILWCDNRTAAQCEAIHERVGLTRLKELAANPAQTGFTAPKLLWVREHEPETYRRAGHALLPKDYLRFRLSGEYATDVADASGTLLPDVRRRTWSGDLLERLEIEPALLPRCIKVRTSARGSALRARPRRVSPGASQSSPAAATRPPVVSGMASCGRG